MPDPPGAALYRSMACRQNSEVQNICKCQLKPMLQRKITAHCFRS